MLIDFVVVLTFAICIVGFFGLMLYGLYKDIKKDDEI